MACRSPGAILQMGTAGYVHAYALSWCAAVHVDRTLHVELACIYTRHAGFEVVDFRMPGLVGGTLVPLSPLRLFEARIHVSVGGLTACVLSCRHSDD